MKTIDEVFEFIEWDIRQRADKFPRYYTNIHPGDGAMRSQIQGIAGNAGMRYRATEADLERLCAIYLSVGCTPNRKMPDPIMLTPGVIQ